MKWLKVAPAVIALGALALSPGRALAQTVQTFEDIPCVGDNVGMYGSVNYNNQWTCYSFPQDPYNPHSGTGRIYTSGTAAPFDFTGGPVTFDGAWFAGHTDVSVNFTLLLGSISVWTSGTMFTSNVPTFLASGYSGMVDGVLVLSNRPGFYVMDDVTFNSPTSVVPEPASVLLLATGLIGVFAVARRRFRSP